MKSETIFGEPIKLEKATLIPVVEISFGLGTGSGRGKQDGDSAGGGAGAGARLTPKAMVVVIDDEVKVFSLAKDGKMADLIDKIPGAVRKVSELFGGGQKKKGEDRGKADVQTKSATVDES